MRIDVHAHYFAPEYVECLRRLGDPRAESRDAVPGGPPTLDEQAQINSAVGIDLQVLSVSLLQPYLPREADAVEAARLSNDVYADACKRYPDRFAAFGCVPLPHVDAALAEAARCLDTLGFLGITIGCSVAGQPLDDPAFEPFWAELDRRAAVLFLHPVGQGMVPERDPYGLNWMVGAPFEDTIAALQLVMSGLVLRHPHIRVIVPHLGGTLPFLLGRIEGALGRRRERGGPVAFDGDAGPLFRRLWYDTVNAHRAALRCACESFGVDRLLLGTDFPYMRDAQLQYLLDVPHEIGLSDAEVAALLGGTAQTLLGIAARSA